MIHCVATDSLPLSPTEMPKVKPTLPLRVPSLMALAKVTGFYGTQVAFLCSSESLCALSQHERYETVRHLFFFAVPPTYMDRYDLVKGEWVKAMADNPVAYELAPFEDAMILNPNDPHQEQVTFRFRRVIPTEIKDEEFTEQ
jgi:hypothetical protein